MAHEARGKREVRRYRGGSRIVVRTKSGAQTVDLTPAEDFEVTVERVERSRALTREPEQVQ